MSWTVYKDGEAVKNATYSTKEKCVAEILVRGWTEDVQRFGVCWAKGVEIRESKSAPLASDT